MKRSTATLPFGKCEFAFVGFLATVLVVGCGQKEPAVKTEKAVLRPLPQLSTGTESAPPQQVVPPPGAAASLIPSPASNQPAVKFDLESLNSSLDDFIDTNKRLPKGIQELVSAGYLSRLPVPPAGRDLVLDEEKKMYVLVAKGGSTSRP